MSLPQPSETSASAQELIHGTVAWKYDETGPRLEGRFNLHVGTATTEAFQEFQQTNQQLLRNLERRMIFTTREIIHPPRN